MPAPRPLRRSSCRLADAHAVRQKAEAVAPLILPPRILGLSDIIELSTSRIARLCRAFQLSERSERSRRARTARVLESRGIQGKTPANIDIYQLRSFGLPLPLRYFVVSNAQDVLRNILLICLRQVRRPAFRHEEVGRKPPPATNRDFSRHFSSATKQFHARRRTNCAKW